MVKIITIIMTISYSILLAHKLEVSFILIINFLQQSL